VLQQWVHGARPLPRSLPRSAGSLVVGGRRDRVCSEEGGDLWSPRAETPALCSGRLPRLRRASCGGDMIAYVLVEGPTDERIVRQLIPRDLLEGVGVHAAGSRSGIASLGRTLLVDRRKPLAVVVDADSVAPEVVEERRQNLDDLLGLVAA